MTSNLVCWPFEVQLTRWYWFLNIFVKKLTFFALFWPFWPPRKIMFALFSQATVKILVWNLKDRLLEWFWKNLQERFLNFCVLPEKWVILPKFDPFSTLILRFSVNILAYRQKFKKRSWSFFQNHPKRLSSKFQVNILIVAWENRANIMFCEGQKRQKRAKMGKKGQFFYKYV